MGTAKVEILEFRENLSDYMESAIPLAITRDGETMGFYVPALRRPDEGGLAALERTGELLRAMMAATGASHDELMTEIKLARRTLRLPR